MLFDIPLDIPYFGNSIFGLYQLELAIDIYIYMYILILYIYIFHHILWIGTTATFFEKARSEAASAATGAGQGLCQFTTSGAASKATKKPWGNDE